MVIESVKNHILTARYRNCKILIGWNCISGCYVTRLSSSGLELIAQKWSHSLIEVDLAWSTATQALDLAVTALADQGAESPLRYNVSLF